jgi:ribosomal protein L33
MENIKIPEKYTIYFQKVDNSNLLLGTMVPENSSASVNSKNVIETKVIDNQPIIGFKIIDKITKYGQGYTHNYVIWRIQDPRGFDTELSHNGLMDIIRFCNIEKGEILEKCIWARGKKENILIPVESSLYKNTIDNIERSKVNATIRDIKPGYKIALVNRIEGIYLGRMYLNIKSSKYSPSSLDLNKKYCLVLEKDTIHIMPNLKINKIIENIEIPLKDIEKDINEKLSSKELNCGNNDVFGFSLKRAK